MKKKLKTFRNLILLNEDELKNFRGGVRGRALNLPENNFTQKIKDIYFASKNGNLSEVHRLLDLGVKPSSKYIKGITPLMVAASNGHTDIMSLLINRGARLNVRDISKKTALVWAASHGQEASVRLLLNNKALVYAKDIRGRSSLYWSRELGYAQIEGLINFKIASIKIERFLQTRIVNL